HYHARLVYRAKQPVSANDFFSNKLRGFLAGANYLVRRRGLLAMGAGYVGGFLRSNEAVETPDVQTHIMLFSADTIGGPLHSFSGFTWPVVGLRRESGGAVRIKSPDPRQAPSLQPTSLSAAKDRDTTLAGIRVLRRIMAAPPMAPFIEAEHEPGPACASDDDL